MLRVLRGICKFRSLHFIVLLSIECACLASSERFFSASALFWEIVNLMLELFHIMEGRAEGGKEGRREGRREERKKGKKEGRREGEEREGRKEGRQAA